jgi:hypothetical protein
MYVSKTGWSCHECQSPTQQRDCCGRKTCDYSSFGGKTIEQMMNHMIHHHGYKKPRGYDEQKKQARNKAKRNRKKDKKRRRRN